MSFVLCLVFLAERVSVVAVFLFFLTYFSRPFHIFFSAQLVNHFFSKKCASPTVKQQELATDGAKEEEFNRGLLKYNTCRSSSLETFIDSEKRYHLSSMKAAGRLKIGSQKVNRNVKCEDSDKVKARLDYSNDCKLEVSCTFPAQQTRRLDMYSYIFMYCFTDSVDARCNGDIEYKAGGEYSNVPVQYV